MRASLLVISVSMFLNGCDPYPLARIVNASGSGVVLYNGGYSQAIESGQTGQLVPAAGSLELKRGNVIVDFGEFRFAPKAYWQSDYFGNRYILGYLIDSKLRIWAVPYRRATFAQLMQQPPDFPWLPQQVERNELP